MFTFLAIIHVIVSVIMVVFILLQDPKGGGGALGMLGGGGGSKSLFGSTGGNKFLVNITKWTAIIFAFTSIYLAALSSQKEDSVMDKYTQEADTAPEGKTESNQPNQKPAPTKPENLQNNQKSTPAKQTSPQIKEEKEPSSDKTE